jgi:hypothetical protein
MDALLFLETPLRMLVGHLKPVTFPSPILP